MNETGNDRKRLRAEVILSRELETVDYDITALNASLVFTTRGKEMTKLLLSKFTTRTKRTANFPLNLV